MNPLDIHPCTSNEIDGLPYEVHTSNGVSAHEFSPQFQILSHERRTFDAVTRNLL